MPGRPEVHAYTLRLDGRRSDAVRAADEALLDASERLRRESFRRAEDRELYLAAHALLRRSLSLHAPVAAEDWRFVAGEHGRPDLTPGLADGLRFSLTHTPGLVACAVTRDVEVGIDAEHVERTLDLEGVARTVFDDGERALLRAEPSLARSRFFELWTLKEAWLKARGYGLSRDARLLGFDLGPPRLRLDPSFAEDPGNWSFSVTPPSPEHCAAVAVRADAAVRWHSL